MKKKEVKEKNKGINKKIIIIPIILIPIIALTIIIFQQVNSYNKKLIKDIKSHYNKYIITNKKTVLYDVNQKEVGKIAKNFQLELVEPKEEKNKYFKIKTTNYYIYYEDVKAIDNLTKNDLNEHYIPLNKNIKTTNKIDLYKDNQKVLELNNGINLPIEYINNNEYNVSYLNTTLQVKKKKNIKEVENKNSNVAETNYVSIMHYENINENCDDYNCITIKNLKEQLKKLEENGYYSITIDEYKNYLAGNIRLKEKAILYTTKNQNKYTDEINKESATHIELVNDQTGLKFNSTNKKSTRENSKETINRYQIKSYSTIENILKMAQGEDVVEKEPVKVIANTNGGGQGIAVLNYHFFYDPTKGETCNESICLTTQKFREHLAYLKNNDYKTLTIEEFRAWMYGEIELPQKSVLITVDDGAMGTGKHNGNKLIPLLEEYNLHATLFLIAGWWDIGNYHSKNLDIQSHTFDMHQYGTCGRGQLVCQPYNEVKEDLQKSLNIIGRKESFCYPFYSYSNTAIQAIKDVGFKMAFAGGSRKATRANNKYIIPRYPIHSNITMNQFINMIS